MDIEVKMIDVSGRKKQQSGIIWPLGDANYSMIKYDAQKAWSLSSIDWIHMIVQ